MSPISFSARRLNFSLWEWTRSASRWTSDTRLINPPVGRGDGIQCGRQITSGVSPNRQSAHSHLVARRNASSLPDAAGIVPDCRVTVRRHVLLVINLRAEKRAVQDFPFRLRLNDYQSAVAATSVARASS